MPGLASALLPWLKSLLLRVLTRAFLRREEGMVTGGGLEVVDVLVV